MQRFIRTDPLSQKSKSFALRIIQLNKFLITEKEFVISNQILKSGTSIGANIAGAVSKAEFTHKLSIAYKECLETEYWLDLLVEGSFIKQNLYESLLKDDLELGKMLYTSINTSKTSPQN